MLFWYKWQALEKDSALMDETLKNLLADGQESEVEKAEAHFAPNRCRVFFMYCRM